jgi:hypothetical protein
MMLLIEDAAMSTGGVELPRTPEEVTDESHQQGGDHEHSFRSKSVRAKLRPAVFFGLCVT